MYMRGPSAPLSGLLVLPKDRGRGTPLYIALSYLSNHQTPHGAMVSASEFCLPLGARLVQGSTPTSDVGI